MTPDEEVAYQLEKKEQQDSGFARFSWLAVVDEVTKGDMTKDEEAYNLNFIAVLNRLSYWKEKQALEDRIRKQNNKK